MNIFLKVLVMVAFIANTALLKIATAQQIGTIGVGDISVSELQNQLGATPTVLAAFDKSINSSLISTRKFIVLNHLELETRLDKQDLTLDGFYDGEYRKSEIYDQIGLDHILKVDVSKFRMASEKNSNSELSVAVIDLEYQMFGVAHLTQDFNAKVSTRISIDPGSMTARQFADHAIAESVERLTQHIATALFPIRIVKVTEDLAITLNYGKGYLSVGDTLKVYADDDSIVLGSSGNPVGEAIATLQVASADNKFALARVLDGADVIVKGLPVYLLRAN